MSNITYENVILTKVLKSKSGNAQLTQLYINNNKGEYPVYSAKTIGETTVGYINEYAFDEEGLQLTTNGANAGTLIYREKHKYSLNGDARLYVIKDEYRNSIDVHYLHIELERTIRKQEFDWRNKATKNKIAHININIPINEDGTYDLEAQISISNKHRLMEEKRSVLLKDKKMLLQAVVDIDLSKYSYIDMPIEKIFDLSQPTNSSKFTKGFIKEHLGDIPVYGATKIDGEVGYGYVSDNAEIVEVRNGNVIRTKVKYFSDCLTYNIDGSAGYVFYRTGRFSLSEKVRPLVIFDEFKDLLDPEYLKYVIQPIFRNNIRGRKGPNGENEFTKISKTIIQELFIPIPIKKDGSFDLSVQREIAGKYKQMEKIKKDLCRQIDNVLEIELEM